MGSCIGKYSRVVFKRNSSSNLITYNYNYTPKEEINNGDLAFACGYINWWTEDWKKSLERLISK